MEKQIFLVIHLAVSESKGEVINVPHKLREQLAINQHYF